MLDSTFVLFGDYDLSGSRDGHVANPSSFERVKKVFKTGTCVLPRFGWVFPVRFNAAILGSVGRHVRSAKTKTLAIMIG